MLTTDYFGYENSNSTNLTTPEVHIGGHVVYGQAIPMYWHGQVRVIGEHHSICYQTCATFHLRIG
jgi:hypothetical protein